MKTIAGANRQSIMQKYAVKNQKLSVEIVR
jgi:hypothetical protein